jgi:hypothetical protein
LFAVHKKTVGSHGMKRSHALRQRHRPRHLCVEVEYLDRSLTALPHNGKCLSHGVSDCRFMVEIYIPMYLSLVQLPRGVALPLLLAGRQTSTTQPPTAGHQPLRPDWKTEVI